MPETGLGGARVLVTRPAHQAETLCRRITAAGGDPVRLPAIEIAGPSDPDTLAETLAHLDRYDIAVFVSPNAVHAALAALGARLPVSLRLAVVGEGSRRALADAGYDQVLAPGERFDSEAVLALPELTSVRGRRILILRGNGGRELLAETLSARGAEVHYAECYRRQLPAHPDRVALARLAAGEIDVAVITSSEALDNLLTLAGEAGRAALLATPLVLVNERQAQAARARGFHGAIRLAARAADADILAALHAWRQARNSL